MNSKKVIVVGAGAAGMMAAGTAAACGASVTLIEKNPRVGRKLMITGKGRCNVLNNCDVTTFIQNVPVNGRFLYSAVSRFTPADAYAFFEEIGVPLKTERGNRCYPQSDKAVDVVDAMRRFVLDNGCRLVQDTVLSLETENGEAVGVKGEKQTYFADSVIVCCGGKSYPLTGSTGDGYRLAQQAGHTIIPPKPSLVPLESSDPECKSMQGLSLRNVALKIRDNNTQKAVYTDFGEMLFTHFGMSGPMILSASSHLRDIDDGRYTAEEQLDKRLQRDLHENANRDVVNAFSKLLPRKLIVPALKRWGVPFDKKCHSVTKEERRRLVLLLKNYTIPISGFRPIEEAIVTEVIDADAYTGGFNLQIAWSTGRLAGESAV